MKKIFIIIFLLYSSSVLSETIEEAILRSGSVVTEHNVSPTLIAGNAYQIRWKVQSYVDLKSRFIIKYSNGTSESIDGVRVIGALQSAGYSIGEYESLFYEFIVEYTVPMNIEGIARVGFYNTQNDDGDFWMFGLFPTDTVDIPYSQAGKQFKISICDTDSSCQILSPVIGEVQEMTSDVGGFGFWKFNQHETGFHTATGGVGGSDDSYAWDINLNRQGQLDTDYGRPVYAVSSGVVTDLYAGATNASSGRVLISHDNGSWFSGYLHMENIEVNTGDNVTQNTVIGYIGSTGTGNNHLHFVVYTGSNIAGGLESFNANIMERERLDSRRQD